VSRIWRLSDLVLKLKDQQSFISIISDLTKVTSHKFPKDCSQDRKVTV
jgi:hypothetical protein